MPNPTLIASRTVVRRVIAGDRLRPLLAGLLVGLLGACATPPPILPEPLRPPKAEGSTTEVLGEDSATRSRPRIEPGPEPAFAGPGPQLERAVSRIPPISRSAPVALVLDGVSIVSFINIVYGMELGLPVQIDQSLRSRQELLSLSVAVPQPPEKTFRIAEEVLRNYGVRIEELGGVLRFQPADQNTGGELPQILFTRSLPDVPAGQRTVFVAMPLQIRQPGPVAAQLRNLFGSHSVTLTELVEENALLISGPGTAVRAAMQAASTLDQSALRNMRSVRINPLYLPAELLAKELQQVLGAQGIGVKTAGGGLGSAAGPVTFVPVASANALIVFAESQVTLGIVQEWAERLDQPSDSGEGGGMYVYAARHTTVATMLPVLQALSGGQPSASPAAPAAEAAAADRAPITGRPGRAGRQSSAQAQQVSAVAGFGGQLAVDTVRNMIVFQGDAQRWRAIQGVLARLDQPARQVLIEVTVAEVTLTDEFAHGVEWALRNIEVDGMSGPLRALAVTPTAGGVNWTALSSSGQVRATLNLFAKDSRVQILSTPRLMVKSGEVASIDVGTEVPTITSQATTSDLGQGSILQSVQYRKTGVLLEIEAVVHSGQRVDLSISQEVSEAAQTDTSDISSPSIFSRKLETSLSLADGQSTLLGGLISSTRSDGKTKVPLLGDIPVLGRAFQNRNRTGNRTELMLLITPYVLEDATQTEAITQAVRDRFGRSEGRWPGQADAESEPLPVPVPSRPIRQEELPGSVQGGASAIPADEA